MSERGQLLRSLLPWANTQARRAGTLIKQNAVLILSAVAIVMFVLALWKIPQWQVPADQVLTAKDRADIENSARLTLAQIVGGVLLVATVYFTWRTIQVTREGQITERFTRAIEQLGSSDLSIRLGGIYALERIARDSERDHWPIMEVLTAYVRKNRRWENHTGSKPEDKPRELPIDIQAILTVIGRRSQTYRRGEDHLLDLAGTDLRRANLTNARLEGTHLGMANLEGADLSRAHLEGANLWGVRLEGTNLSGARLRGADLGGTDLRGAESLTREQIGEAVTDGDTVLPDDLKGDRVGRRARRR